MTQVVNEGTTHMVTATFRDETGAAVIPTGGTWRVDDVTSGQEVVPDTPFVPVSSSHVVTIPASANLLIDPVSRIEARRLTLSFDYPGGRATAEYLYRVKNLAGIF